MGHGPRRNAPPMRPGPRTPAGMATRLDVARQEYVLGRIDLAEFERRADVLIASGQDEDPGIVDCGPRGFVDPAPRAGR